MVELERPTTRRLKRSANRPLCVLPGLCLVLAACGPATDSEPEAEARVVNLYSFANYVSSDVLERFEHESGIDVQHDLFDNYEILETKLLTGRSGYDVVVIGADALRVVPAGALQPLDRSRLPNWRHLDDALMQQLSVNDPEGRFLAGYAWGTTALAYDAALIRKVAPDAPLDSWSLVLEPVHAKRIARCGISVLDARSEVIGLTLAFLGLDPNSGDAADLASAENVLAGVRPFIRKFDVDGQISDLASGETCAMITPSGIVGPARERAAEAGRAAELRYVIPREGAPSWFDALAIPADAPHPDDAHALIDFLLRPQSAAVFTNEFGIASLNAAATELVDESIRTDASIYPPADVMSRLTTIRPDSQAQSRAETRVWTRIKTGQ